MKKIISANEINTDIDEKFESLNSKSFRTIEKILQLKEDMMCQKKLLIEKFDNLNVLNAELHQIQDSINYSVEKVCDKSDI